MHVDHRLCCGASCIVELPISQCSSDRRSLGDDRRRLLLIAPVALGYLQWRGGAYVWAPFSYCVIDVRHYKRSLCPGQAVAQVCGRAKLVLVSFPAKNSASKGKQLQQSILECVKMRSHVSQMVYSSIPMEEMYVLNGNPTKVVCIYSDSDVRG